MTENVWYMVSEGISILPLLGASAFFSGSEVALTSISAVKISHVTAEEGESHPLNDWLMNPSKYLTTLLVGTNVANIAAALLAGDFFRRLVLELSGPSRAQGPLPGILAFILMTFLVLVFGEILPKIYCRHYHERIAPKVVMPLAVLYRFLKYPIHVLIWVANGFVRLVGGEPSSDFSAVTSEELKTLIEFGEKQGHVEEGQREMLHGVFGLSETLVREVMVPRVDIVFVNIEDDLDAVLKTFEERDFSRLPVMDGSRDNVVGILHMRDLLHHWRSSEFSSDFVRTLMRPCMYIPEAKRIDDVLEQFQKEKSHMAIVVDEYGGTDGLVTIEDVLEEIVGEIHDEFDDEEHPIVRVARETWIVDATVDPEDLAEELGIDLSEEEESFESLAGYLLEKHEDLPKPGEILMNNSLKFTILEADEKRIRKVRVERLRKDESLIARAGDEESAE